MNIKMIMLMAIEYCRKRFSHNLITILLTACTGFLLSISIFCFVYNRYGSCLFDKTLKGNDTILLWFNGMDGVDMMHVLASEDNSSVSKKTVDFIDALINLEYIDGISSATEYDRSDLLADLSLNNNDTFSSKQLICYDLYGVSPFNVCRFELSEGRYPEEIKNNNKRLVYLGSDFSKGLVGKKTDDYLVAGILKKGSRWIDSDICYAGLFESDNYILDLDNSGLILTDQITLGASYAISIKNEKNAVDAMQAIRQIAREKNINVKLKSSKTAISDKMNSHSLDGVFVLGEGTKSALILLVFMTMFCTICNQYLLQKKAESDFFLLKAFGAGEKDIFWIISIENYIRLFLASFIAFTVAGFVYRSQILINSELVPLFIRHVFIMAAGLYAIVILIYGMIISVISIKINR